MVIPVILNEMKEAEMEYFWVYLKLVPMMIFIYLDPLKIAKIKSQQKTKHIQTRIAFSFCSPILKGMLETSTHNLHVIKDVDFECKYIYNT